MIVGMIILTVAAALILFGAGQRVLDRMRLTDRQAIFCMALILAGGFLPNISIGNRFSMNIGGFLVPVALCAYLFVKADSGKERLRAIGAALLSGAAIWALGKFFPDEPEAMPFDINYLYGIAAGIIACVLGRSRRAAFIGGALGVILADVVQAVLNALDGIFQPFVLGGGGIYDTIIISAFSAVLLRELIGEGHERMTRKTGAPGRRFEGGSIVPEVLSAQREEENQKPSQATDPIFHHVDEEAPDDED